jgi:hypothetical protein
MTMSVSHDVLLRCQAPSGRRTTLAATLEYAESDPYAVRVVFHGPADDVTWLVDRQLLMAGRYVPAGVGDVLIRPDLDGRVEIRFRSPAGSLVTLLPLADLDHFLARTLAIVPLGREQVDTERLREALLGSQTE